VCVCVLHFLVHQSNCNGHSFNCCGARARQRTGVEDRGREQWRVRELVHRDGARAGVLRGPQGGREGGGAGRCGAGARARHGEAQPDELVAARGPLVADCGARRAVPVLPRAPGQRRWRSGSDGQGCARQRCHYVRVVEDAPARGQDARSGFEGRPDLPRCGERRHAGDLRRERRVHAFGMRGAVEQGGEQVHVPLPWLPVQHPGHGCARAGSSVAGAGACGCHRRQGGVHSLDRDRLPDRRGPLVVIGSSSS
jgi:hypothetical protein